MFVNHADALLLQQNLIIKTISAMKFNHLLNSIETTHVHFQEIAARAINRSLTVSRRRTEKM